MRVTLNQTEVFTAIANFVRSKWKLDDATTVDISLTAGRSPKGYTADVEITYPEDAASNITTRVVESEVLEVAEPVALNIVGDAAAEPAAVDATAGGAVPTSALFD